MKDNKEKVEPMCHCARTSMYHTQDSTYKNHSVDRCWTGLNECCKCKRKRGTVSVDCACGCHESNEKREWERKLADETYFLSQDGYGHGWIQMKVNAIKEIIEEALKNQKEELLEAILKEVEAEKWVNPPKFGLKAMDMNERAFEKSWEEHNIIIDYLADIIRKYRISLK